MIKLKEILIREDITREDLNNPAFVEGMRLAVRDKRDGVRRDLVGAGENVVRGYEAIMDYEDLGGNSWWDRVNDKLTRWVSDIGTTFFDKK